jgi:hypothetical protein
VPVVVQWPQAPHSSPWLMVTVHPLPLHVEVLQTELLHVNAVPPHPPLPLQTSSLVQRLLSLQAVDEPGKVTVQLDVPLQARLAPHGGASFVQPMGVPAQPPAALQTSLKVQRLLSLQPTFPPGYWAAQVAVPLQVRTRPQGPGSLVQVMDFP